MRYGLEAMHGLRCSPTLLGWTRLLDEWVVGLTDFDRQYADEPTCWDEPERTRATLVSAARRVVAFAGRAPEDPSLVTETEGFVEFELQGVRYLVAIDQLSPTRAEGLAESVRDALEALTVRASERADAGQVGVGALFVTPRLAPPHSPETRWARIEPLFRTVHDLASSGCAYSFPAVEEMHRFHYTNDARPGAILTILA